MLVSVRENMSNLINAIIVNLIGILIRYDVKVIERKSSINF